ncbi:MAG: ribonuclease Z [Acidimicrobiia bacterium]|nr:ribonuclease Z [Acidimicrobiia bacterium]
MEITLLGTGNPLPDPDRAGPSTLVRAGETNLLVDAGRGVLQRLAATGLTPMAVSGILLTHLHSDHLTDLNDVITSHWVFSPAARPLRVWGPPRTEEVVVATLAALAPDIEYRMAHHADLTWRPDVEVREVEPGDVLAVGDVTVRVGRTDHRPVDPSVGYRVEYDGVSVVLAGDGVPCEELDVLCSGTDAYVQTVLRADIIGAVANPRMQDILGYHSSVEQAAGTAERAGARVLVLTHYVPAPYTGQEEEWRRLAAEVFDGEIVMGDDLTTVSV